MRETLKGVEASHLLPGTSLRNPNPSHDEIGGAQNCDHAKDHDRPEPVQDDFVEIIPLPPGGLHQDAFPLVWLGDLPLDAWRLLKQLLLAGHARSRVWRALLAQLLCQHRWC